MDFIFKWIFLISLLFLLIVSYCCQLDINNAQSLLIFPNAEGFGRFTKGGRGGEIRRVTNLKGNGPGSLRDAVKYNGPRTVVFEISGTINLEKDLMIKNPSITIAGQTAPSPGILLKGGTVDIKTHNVLIQHIRIRSGLDTDDGLRFGAGNSENIYNVYLDHVSVSWGVDETMSVFQNKDGYVHDISIDHCIISEGLAKNSTHNGAMGFLINKGDEPKHNIVGPISITKSIFAHNNQRNPMIYNGVELVLSNNIIYGYRHTALDINGRAAGIAKVSVINNVFKTRIPTKISPVNGDDNPNVELYLSGNELDGNVPSNQSTLVSRNLTQVNHSPLALNGVKILSIQITENYLLNQAGARPIDRDSVDARIVNEIRTNTGDWMDQTEVHDAYPHLTNNTESFAISNPNADDDDDGYTNLEELLFEMKLKIEGKSN